MQWLNFYAELFFNQGIKIITREEMQNMLDVFTDYCKQWKLHVNIDKTKVVVFSKRRYEANHKFKVIGEEIQFSDNYCYLGVLFNYNY